MIIAASAALLLWLFWLKLWPWLLGWFAEKFSGNETAESAAAHLGQFGDSYGALNSLFTGGAFIVLIWALLMQRQELSLQREELSLQRQEMEQTRTTLKLQVFESTFFGLLYNYGKTTNSIGADKIEKMVKMYSGFSSLEECKKHPPIPEILRLFDAFSHLIWYIGSAPIRGIDRTKYTVFIDRQVTPNEMTLLLLYCRLCNSEINKLLIKEFFSKNSALLIGRFPNFGEDIISYLYD